MNKYLVATAAALLLSVGSASADSTFLIRLHGLPSIASNTFVVTHQTGSTANPADTYSAIQKSNGVTVAIGAGMPGVTKEWGNSVILGVSQTFLGQVCYVFQRPFVTGASWEAYYTKDGIQMIELGHGTYTVSQPTVQ